MYSIREYFPTTLPPRGLIQTVIGPSKATLEFEKELEQDNIKRYLNFLSDDMTALWNNIRKQLLEVEEYNKYLIRKINSEFSEEHRIQLPTERKLQIIDISQRTIEPYFTEIERLAELLSKTMEKYDEYEKKVEVKSPRSQDYFKKLIESDVPTRIQKMKEKYEKIQQKTIEKDEKIKEEEKIKMEERKNIPNPSNFNPRADQTYVPGGNSKSKPPPKTSPNKSNKKIKTDTSTVKLIPNQYFRDMVLKYTGKTMTSPVADKKEIDKMYKKLSLYIHAASTKYQKLSTAEKKEADEIFKKINTEKEKYVPKSGKKGTKKTKPKKTKPKKPKKTKKAKKKS